jgi:hypothetical protein
VRFETFQPVRHLRRTARAILPSYLKLSDNGGCRLLNFFSKETMRVIAVGRPELPPFLMPDRFRTEVVYFSTPPGDRSAPSDLSNREYWIARADTEKYLEEFVVRIVSPLDAASKAEIELSEEQEAWLEWLLKNNVERVRVE